MRPDVLIVGQGLAGTLLAWELERAGISFAIMESRTGVAASRVAAGIINPITGRRLVKSWRVDAYLPEARSVFRAMEAEFGVPLWREMRVRRLFADDRERRIFREKRATGELAPFAGEADETGFWIEGAARMDLPAMLDAARRRWEAQGRFRWQNEPGDREGGNHEMVIDCSGVAGTRRAEVAFVPWEFSRGEVLTVAVEGLAPDVVLNRGHWVLPLRPGLAAVGATHEPGVVDSEPTATGRAKLEASAGLLLAGRAFAVVGHVAGIRVNLPDKRPIVGRHPSDPRLGIFNGLGAKGALVAPALARQWANHLTSRAPFDAETDVARFFRPPFVAGLVAG